MPIHSHFTRAAGILLILGFAAVAQPPGFPPPGQFEPPKPGEIMPGFMQQRLNLTAEQKKQIADLQKDVDAKLAKVLTEKQKKELHDRPGFGPPFGFGPGGFPGGPSAGFDAIRLEDVKKAIEATDEEWKVIGPKLQKVIAFRQILATETRSEKAGAARPADAPVGEKPARADTKRPAPGRSEGPGQVNVITQAQADFKAVLDDAKHTKVELQEAAAAVRKARDKVRADLVAAQKDLRQLLTKDQETILVGLGHLD